MKKSLNIVNVCTMHESPQIHLHMVFLCLFIPHHSFQGPYTLVCVFNAAPFSVVWNSFRAMDPLTKCLQPRRDEEKENKKREISKPKLKPHKLHRWYSCLSSATHASCLRFATIELKSDDSSFFLSILLFIFSNLCSFPLFPIFLFEFLRLLCASTSSTSNYTLFCFPSILNTPNAEQNEQSYTLCV